MFFRLPNEIQIELLTCWLEAEDAYKLDLAVMCHKHRQELMKLLSSPECILGELHLGDRVRNWIVSRQVKLTSVSIEQIELDTEPVGEMMQIVGPTLKSLYYEGYNWQEVDDDDDDDSMVEAIAMARTFSTDQTLYSFHMHLTNLVHLQVTRCDVVCLFPVLTSNKNTLKSLKLTDCNNVNAPIFMACSESPCLEELMFDDCGFTDNALSYQGKLNTTCQELTLLGDMDHPSIVSRFLNLRSLHADCFGAALVFVSRRCALVENAEITICGAPLTLNQAETIAKNWVHLVKLHLRGCEDAGIVKEFVKNCSKLQEVDLAEYRSGLVTYRWSTTQ